MLSEALNCLINGTAATAAAEGEGMVCRAL